jgi:hypothetical protein
MMRRDLACRLAKAEASAPDISWADRQAAHRRQSLRTCMKLSDLIRERLCLVGIDPALAVSLRRGEEAAAELAAIPDSADLKADDEKILTSDYSNGNDAVTEFGAKIVRIAELYRTGEHRLDLANASPAELLAFCVSVEIEAWG